MIARMPRCASCQGYCFSDYYKTFEMTLSTLSVCSSEPLTIEQLRQAHASISLALAARVH